ncbi:MAG: glutamine synthetase [Actinobacteria bacterium]|nr:glutamine synthetase [Actinomycetota bacterium]
MTAADVIAQVEERDVRFVRLWFTDILGQLKSFSINAAELADAFDGGAGFDGSSITGFNAIEESDMIAMPDPSTFAVLPWRPDDQGVARMFCDIVTPDRRPYEGDPRHALRRAVERASELGFDTFNVGPELEYYYFKEGQVAPGAAPEPLDQGGYFDLTTLDAGSDIRRDTVLALEQMGIHVEYTHHEVGPSQQEIDMRYADAMKMADDCMTYRIVVKEYAMKYGYHATFMPKPLYGQNGSGMHTHQSLFKDGKELAVRAEIRCPDPACNPYLTFAALLQAGLEGIEQGYELPEPMEKNLYHLTIEDGRRLSVEHLPETLGEAVELAAGSELVLRTLGEHMFNRFIEIKRQEWEGYRVQVTQWELDRYLPIL